MTADHLTYQRATRVSLIGLGIQCVLSVVLFVYAFQASDAAAMTGSFAMMLGIGVWAALALVFHQHRLERLEAMEADAYARSSAAQATVFEEAGSDQLVQAERLAWMHKWFLPGFSLLLSASFIGIGLFRYATRPEEPVPPEQAGWPIAIGVSIAVICFVFARFVAGMAKQKVWSLLHAGSAFAVGAAIIGLIIAVGFFVDVLTSQSRLLELLPIIMQFLMVGIGAEMLLNFVLNLYRPRKPGEYPRPAFDSRVLAFIAAPDRLAESISEAINYQLGFNVSSTWFYQLLTRAMGILTLLAIVSLWGLSCFTVIKPNEQGLLIRNGKLIGSRDPGLVVKAPWPFATVETYPTSAVTQLNVGASPAPDSAPAILWSKAHTEDERFFIVQASSDAVVGDSENLALLVAEVPVQFVVDDLVKYTKLAQDGPRGRKDQYRHEILEYFARSAIVEYLGTRSVGAILGAERGEIADAVRERVQAEFDALDAGVRVLFVGVAGVHPEVEVAKSFIEVVAADLIRQASIAEAEEYRIRTITSVAGDLQRANQIITELEALDELNERIRDREASGESVESLRSDAEAQRRRVAELIRDAGGEVARVLERARAYRWTEAMGTRARAERSRGQVQAYEAAPAYFRITRYLDALKQAAVGARVWITVFDDPNIEIDQRDEDLAVSSVRPEDEDSEQE
ncbi:MAG: SPFH domain-containing protein [Phycisphaerales bacterium]